MMYRGYYLETKAKYRESSARPLVHPLRAHPIQKMPGPAPVMVIHDEFIECRDFMDNQDWDAARQALQRIAYTMVDEEPEVKAKFTALMAEFASRDPLLSAVLRVVMPIVRSEPGILQTQVYKHLPGIGVEDARYALYFAEQLGILRRQKKGNSYRLLPIGDVITAD